MAVYTPTNVSTEHELIVALEVKAKCICIVNEDFFWETRKQAETSKAAKKKKEKGKFGMCMGVLGLAVFSGGAGLVAGAIFGGSAIFTALSHKKDAFKGYDMYMDYPGRRVILIRDTKKDPFNKNKDIITGIDLDYLDNLALIDKKK